MLEQDSALKAQEIGDILKVTRQSVAHTKAWKENRELLKAIRMNNKAMLEENSRKLDDHEGMQYKRPLQ